MTALPPARPLPSLLLPRLGAYLAALGASLGLIAGLVARGAPLENATMWGVALHARAGARLAERFGPLGYLAREIPHEVPAIMAALSGA